MLRPLSQTSYPGLGRVRYKLCLRNSARLAKLVIVRVAEIGGTFSVSLIERSISMVGALFVQFYLNSNY